MIKNIAAYFLDVSEGGENPAGQWLSLLIMVAVLGLAIYFMIYRPQKKQERETKEMRSSLSIGDVITTHGGIVGVIVKMKDDMLLIESGADRTKFQIQSWAVRNVLSRVNQKDE